MRNPDPVSTTSGNLRRIFAALFLIFLLAEWGSHGVITASSTSADGQEMSAYDSGHEDPCQSLVLCSDSQRKDRQIPSFGHEAIHNGLLDTTLDLRAAIDVTDDPLIPFAATDGLSRPPDPAFHPPELS